SGCAPCLTVSNGSAVVMSAATYNVIGELFKNDTDGNQWGYWLGRMTDSPIAVPENGSVSIAAGGNFAISTTPDKSGYSAGEQVVLSNRFADSLGNQLNEIYVQQIASSGQEQNPVLSDKTLPGISCCGSVQDQQSPLAAGAVYPRIVVTDPNGLIIVDESSWNIWCQWNGYSFTLPANAIGGTYSVALTLDTGPHQGTITAGATFQVGDHGIQVQVLNQAGAPAQYANVFAYSNISGPPVAMATTNQSGSASLDVPNGSNYTLVVSSSADHFLVTKEGVAAPCSATINTQDTVGVTFDCRNLNGNAFDADILLYLYGHVALLGSTGADGQLQASITGMTYPVVQALSPSALYFLYRTSVTVGEGSVIEFHAYQMPTGRITIDLVGFSKVIEPYWSGDIVIPDGSSIVVSPGIYPISGKLRLTAGNANEWDYSLAARLVGVTQGGVSVFQAGGAFTAATAPGQASYWAGETVTLQNRVTDAFGNRITSIDVGDYEAPASWQSDSHFLGQSTELAGYAFERASVQDIGWTRVNPKIVVSDPTGGTVLDEMSPQAWGDYSFDLATEAAGGTWSVALSLDTGPHQGLIDASNGFAVNGLGSISGHVYDQHGQPIPNVLIVTKGAGGYAETTTQSDGAYRLAGLRTGTYWVFTCASCSGLNYIDEEYGNPVSVTAPNNTPNINFTLDLGGTISGHVYQSDGVTPIDNVDVYAYLVPAPTPPPPSPTPPPTYTPTSHPASGELTGNPGVKPGTADKGNDSFAPSGATNLGTKALMASDGSYTILGLQTGNYVVYAVAEGYIREYYNGVWNSNEATQVSVTVEQNTIGIDFRLDLGGTISGYVYQADSVTPISGVFVSAYDPNGGYDGYTWTASDGSYTIRGLPTGNYRVEAYADGYIREYYQKTSSYQQATPVSVTAPSNTPNINFTLDLGGSISGHVYQSDGVTPIAGAWINANLIDGNYGMGANTASNGSYTIRGLVSGNYRVEANATDYIREYYQETYRYDQSTPVSVTAPNNTPNINFSLDLGGTISGHVYQSDGVTPIAGASVYCYTEDSGGYKGGTSTAPDGSYNIRGLPSGNYRVEANATGYIREYYQETSSYDQATPVAVTMPNNTPNINFTLDLGGTISGHVYRSDGVTPIAGAWINANLIDGNYGMGATTASDGSYTIRGLPSGSYRVEANATDYIREYYQETFNYQQATPVSVTMPNNTPNINFTLDLGGTISGHVYQSDGVTPIDNVSVYAYMVPESAPAPAPTPTATPTPTSTPASGKLTGNQGVKPGTAENGSDYFAPSGETKLGTKALMASDGSYTITGLRTGNYLVYAVADGYIREFYNGTYNSNNATSVSVTAPSNTP
ncbi:MAG: carboxypeptidase-like regulatory domain-containing protein, partial [Dehalococcoidia bacterium]